MRSFSGVFALAATAGVACRSATSNRPSPTAATVPAITAADREHRLNIIADDSSDGRGLAATRAHCRGTGANQLDSRQPAPDASAPLDSIRNGADDDGSGTVSILEIAKAMAKGPARPRRSILFVSHTAEEAGLLGSAWFTDHATVPVDSIVAEIDQDMVGRGLPTDVPKPSNPQAPCRQ